MTLNFWLYVSRCVVPSTEGEKAIEDIVCVSQDRNSTLGVTGVLLFSGTHFAQLIEGPPETILTLRTAIMRDARHTEIKTIGVGNLAERSFKSWSLAYSGPSMVVSRTVQRVLREADDSPSTARTVLLQLMQELIFQH